MHGTHMHSKRWKSRALWLAGTLLVASGCSRGSAPEEAQALSSASAAARSEKPREGKVSELAELPFIEPSEAAQVFAQQLEQPTELKENMALHMKLPPPRNKELQDSLVRVIGEPRRPLVLFRSDALEKLGVLSKSPGPEFFTTLTRFSEEEVEVRLKNEELLASGKFGKPEEETRLFDGRRPIGRTKGLPFDRSAFKDRLPVPMTICPATPASTEEAWGQSLLIRDPAVVGNDERTWDPCTGEGTEGGKWTFAYLMTEMAQNSGLTPQEFVRQWLETWVNDQNINGDVVPARQEMFHQVIQPWADASGIFAELAVNPFTDKYEVRLDSPGLDLKIAPFRLLAIVNRIDLGRSAPGVSVYGGAVTERPTDAGELRFVFGVALPEQWGGGSEETCDKKPFTVILEYGVPGTGCTHVRDWAQDWTRLNTFGGFTEDYLAHLESLTERVVRRDLAPNKGNRNAINQIRTNDNALGSWEMREFTLSIENHDAPPGTPDTPANGPLRMHTVAQTPDDSAHPSGSPLVSDFILNEVVNGLSSPLGPLPANCSASYVVPFKYQGQDFRGGNALIPPVSWFATGADPSDPRHVCARFQFSLNTCNGCHSGETATAFTHIDPTSARPATLSNFLTGGGTGMMSNIPDALPGSSTTWQFAELDQRFKRLYQLAHCTSCTRVPLFGADFIRAFVEVAHVLPIDPIGPIEKPDFKIGPVRDLDVVSKLLEVRAGFAKDFRDEPVDFIRPAERQVH